MAKEQSAGTNSKKLYELGYLLVPTIAEENISTEAEAVKAIINKAEGEIVAEDSPKLISLAYSMVHGASGQKKKFDKAYFGWVKFNAEAAAAEFIKKVCHSDTRFLRFMIVKTVKDEPQTVAPRAHLKTVVASGPAVKEHVPTEIPAEADKKPVDEVELDKTLERLAV
jgi:ribosomal protein S6